MRNSVFKRFSGRINYRPLSINYTLVSGAHNCCGRKSIISYSRIYTYIIIVSGRDEPRVNIIIYFAFIGNDKLNNIENVRYFRIDRISKGKGKKNSPRPELDVKNERVDIKVRNHDPKSFQFRFSNRYLSNVTVSRG